MSERMEWRVVCANGSTNCDFADSLNLVPPWLIDECSARLGSGCGPHRVQSRTVSTSEWADTDVTA